MCRCFGEAGMTASATRLSQAIELHRQGKLEEAETIYAAILEQEPRNADVHQFLGLIALRRGDLDGAIARISRAVQLKPKVGVYHFNLGLAQQRRGDNPEAIASYRRAVTLQPDLAEAHNNLGNALRECGEIAAALESSRRAVTLRPTYAEAHVNLGSALQAMGRLEEAAASVHRALGLAPNLAAAHRTLGDILQLQGKFEAAVPVYERALQLEPQQPAVYLNLGSALQTLGRVAEAVAAYQRVLELQPESVEALNNLGNAYLTVGDRPAAEAFYRRTLDRDPNFALAWNNLGVVLQQNGQLDDARDAYDRSCAIRADADAHNNLGLLLPIFGEVDAALQHFRQAIEQRPDFITAYRNLMGVMLYGSEGERFGVAREFGRRYGAGVTRREFRNLRDEGRRLKIGYVSSDFYEHPVGRNLEPVLAGRDRKRFEVVLYAEVAREDATSARLKGLVEVWRNTVGQTDAQVASQVLADGIDVLVLLAGRFDRNRPLVASHRSAPVQVSFHDPGTSGVAGMDYLIADPVLVPRKPQEQFTERVVRLPWFYIHAPLAEVAVGEPPSLRTGRVTFGSFNNPAKVSAEVLGLWRRVLEAVPGSVLRVRFKNWFGNAGLRARFEAGLGASRVEFETSDAVLEEHLGSYNGIDVALDPLPFTGSTTTFEALWMGVPVVTRLGESMAGRWSGSMLRSLGLGELVAASADDYVRIAAALAVDAGRRAELRRTLRERVRRSPLCDGTGRARQLERLYRALWRRWCRTA
jgi:protein O-GlcNAc transferase